MSISSGTFVSWPGGQGRVDLVVVTGTVPGVPGDPEVKDGDPSARVAVWVDDKPTGVKVALPLSGLSPIAPLDVPEVKGTAAERLVALHGSHDAAVEEMGLGKGARLSGKSIQTAYERGVKSWPGAEVTTLSAEDWGVARAEWLCKAAVGEVTQTNDADLLSKDSALVATAPRPSLPLLDETYIIDPGQPLDLMDGATAATKGEDDEPVEPEDEVVVDAAEVAKMLAAIDEETAVDD